MTKLFRCRKSRSKQIKPPLRKHQFRFIFDALRGYSFLELRILRRNSNVKGILIRLRLNCRWEVGGVRNTSFGFRISSKIITVGCSGRYRLNFFPLVNFDPANMFRLFFALAVKVMVIFRDSRTRNMLHFTLQMWTVKLLEKTHKTQSELRRKRSPVSRSHFLAKRSKRMATPLQSQEQGSGHPSCAS